MMMKLSFTTMKLCIFAFLAGVLGTSAGLVVGAIPGMLVYGAAVQSGVFIMEYFLMIVAFCSLWCTSVFMSIVTTQIGGLSRFKRIGYVALSFIPSAVVWIGFGLTAEPVWFRTGGAVVGVVLGLTALVIPFACGTEQELAVD